MLNRYATRERAGEISRELLEGRRAPERICGEELLSPGAQTGGGELAGVLLSLPRENDAQRRERRYQPGFSEHFEIGVRIPLRIDSRIPGIWSR